MTGSALIFHLKRNAVAYLALFVALGGAGAWAAQMIGPGQIKPRAVRAKHIKPRAVGARHLKSRAVRARHLQGRAVRRRHIAPGSVGNGQLGPGSVTPDKIDLVFHDEALGLITTDFFQGDPEVILTPPAGALLAAFATVEGRKVTNSFTGQPCLVELIEDPEPFEAASGGHGLMTFANTGFTTRATFPGSDDGVAGTDGSWKIFPAAEPGVRTRYRFYYQHRLGDTCAFRNRRLWLMVIR